MRAPEETARLANGVTVEIPECGVTTVVTLGGEEAQMLFDDHSRVSDVEAIFYLAAALAEARAALEVETQWRCQASDAYHEAARRLANTESDLSEARAEVAALRGHVALMAEWQAAKRASTITEGSGQSWNELRIANDEREAIEARMLSVLPSEEVGRG